MDYVKIHDDFVEYCKHTTPQYRLDKRNQNDNRLLDNYELYTETHHILLRSLGGTDDLDNLIELLPEEHLFIHKLRYKAFNERESMLAVRFILNGLNNKSQGNFNKTRMKLTKPILNGYAFIKQHSFNFRKEYGWQTSDGVARISEARKNTFPVKDVKTGEIIGSFDKSHPKILSGEWVHHSKGMSKYVDTRTGEQVYIDVSEKQDYHKGIRDNSGENNSRWSGITDEEILAAHSNISKMFGFVTHMPLLRKCAKLLYGIDIPKSFSAYRFPDTSLLELTKKETGLEYYSHHTKERKEIIKEKLKEIYDKN